MKLRQLDKKYFGRQGEAEDIIVGNSADSYLTDARGRKIHRLHDGLVRRQPGVS